MADKLFEKITIGSFSYNERTELLLLSVEVSTFLRMILVSSWRLLLLTMVLILGLKNLPAVKLNSPLVKSFPDATIIGIIGSDFAEKLESSLFKVYDSV